MTWKKEVAKEQVIEKQAKIKRPEVYKVFLLNDDYTTMDFVVSILMFIFNKKENDAINIMLQVHNRGKALAGIYIKDIAESKVQAVYALAKSHGYPLRCSIERD